MAMLLTGQDLRHSPAYRMGGLLLFSATGVILLALAFEYLGGYVPCPLCLQERYAYYAAIPLLLAALVLVAAGHERVAVAVFALVGVVFLINTGLGTYHAGVEWGFWPGPDSCSATSQPLSSNAGGLLQELGKTRVIRCDEAPWHFLGLSFAGWNAVISLLLAAGALNAGLKAVRSYP